MAEQKKDPWNSIGGTIIMCACYLYFLYCMWMAVLWAVGHTKWKEQGLFNQLNIIVGMLSWFWLILALIVKACD